MRIFGIPVMLGMMVILSGCGQKAVMDKLKSDAVYPELDPPFFANEFKNKSALWTEAWEYCRLSPHKPNCGPVVQIGFFGETDVPAYGSSGESISLFSYK